MQSADSVIAIRDNLNARSQVSGQRFPDHSNVHCRIAGIKIRRITDRYYRFFMRRKGRGKIIDGTDSHDFAGPVPDCKLAEAISLGARFAQTRE